MQLTKPIYAALAVAGWCAGKVGAAGSSALSTVSSALSSRELPQPTPKTVYVGGRGVEVRPELLENPTSETLQAAAEIQRAWRQERDLEQLKNRIHEGVKRSSHCANERDRPAPYTYTNTDGVVRSVDCNDLDYIYSPDAATRPLAAVITQNIQYFVASDTYYETRYREEDCSTFGWGWAYCTRSYAHAVTTYRIGERAAGYRADYVPDTTAEYEKTACQAAAPFVVQRRIGYNPNVQSVVDRSIRTNDFTGACAAAIDSCVAVQEFVCDPIPVPTPTPSSSLSASTARFSAAGNTTYALPENSTPSSSIEASSQLISSGVSSAVSSSSAVGSSPSSSTSGSTSSATKPVVTPSDTQDAPIDPTQFTHAGHDGGIDPGPGVAIGIGAAGGLGILAAAAGVATLIAKKRHNAVYHLPHSASVVDLTTIPESNT